jgi:hypothetical protein
MASAFAQGFQMGGDMYDSAERIKLMKEQQQWAREEAEAKRAERQREADIRTAGAETYGMVGKPVEYQGGEMGPQPEAAQTALRSDIATAPAKMYSEDQAQQDYLRRLRGLDVGKAQQFEKGALELGEIKRGVRYGDKQELALGFNDSIIKDLTAANGDAASVIEKRFLPLYNADKLDGFKDGGKAKLVPSAMGDGKSILITYKDGKQETLPADLKTLQQLTMYTQDKMMRSSTPENFWKGKEHDIKEKTAASQETSANAAAQNATTQQKHLDAQIKANLFGAQANQANAAANASNAHAAVYSNMVELAKTNKEAGLAVKEALAKYEALSEEERAGPKGQQILTEGALAAAKKTGDVTGIMNALKKPDRSTVTAEAEKAAYALYNEAVATGDPKRIAAAKAAYPQVFGPSALDKAIADKTKPPAAAAAPSAAPAPAASAIPTTSTPAAPVAAIPATAPPVTKSVAYGKTGYQIKGVTGVFKSPEEAQAAWAQRYAKQSDTRFD